MRKSMITTCTPHTHTILPALPPRADSAQPTGVLAWHSTDGLVQCQELLAWCSTRGIAPGVWYIGMALAVWCSDRRVSGLVQWHISYS